MWRQRDVNNLLPLLLLLHLNIFEILALNNFFQIYFQSFIIIPCNLSNLSFKFSSKNVKHYAKSPMYKN